MMTKQKNDTKKIQAMIDEAHKKGGGKVTIPEGSYEIGSLRLYSNITLYLQAGAKVYGSRDYRDYEDFHVPTTMRYVNDEEYKEKWNLPDYYIYGMVCAFGEESIAIVGEEGSFFDGQDCFDANGEEKFRGPMGIIFSNCKNVTLRGYTFQNSANWSHQLDSCRHVTIDNVSILAGHDGFNLHHCRDISISCCRLKTGDDCLAGYDVENLKVKDCYLNTACNSMRIGGTDLVFEDCVFEGPGQYPHRSENTYHTHAMFKYYAMGADVVGQDGKHILFKNCRFSRITMLFSYRHGEKALMQDNRPLRDLAIEGGSIDGLSKKAYFYGNGEACVLTLRNVEFGENETCPEDEILEIDDKVTLVLDRVTSPKPVKIAVLGDGKVSVSQCSNLEIIRSSTRQNDFGGVN